MIKVENLSFTYKKSKKDIFNSMSFTLQKGNVYGLLGKNGSGKSTLLYLMAGLLTPSKGKVVYNDVDVRRRLPATLQDIFFVPEEFELPSTSLVSYIENNSPFYPNFSKEEMIRYLALFEMDINVNLGALSMGQKKKVFMSFALASNTSLLIMDEPTNGLDIPGKSQFRKLIASGMSDDKSIIISTHQVRDIDKILNHIIILDNKEIKLNASIEDICSKYIFTETENNSIIEKALFALPSIQGTAVILPNENGEESEINIELLFGAITANNNNNNPIKIDR